MSPPISSLSLIDQVLVFYLFHLQQAPLVQQVLEDVRLDPAAGVLELLGHPRPLFIVHDIIRDHDVQAFFP